MIPYLPQIVVFALIGVAIYRAIKQDWHTVALCLIGLALMVS